MQVVAGTVYLIGLLLGGFGSQLDFVPGLLVGVAGGPLVLWLARRLDSRPRFQRLFVLPSDARPPYSRHTLN